MFRAANDHRRRFGEAVGIWCFMDAQDARALERELRAAIACNEPVTMEELYERTGVPPPPPDVEL
jgi:hypothetical protein